MLRHVQGNELFKKHDYMGAVAAYTKAVNVDAPRAVYMSNLAMTYLKMDMCARNILRLYLTYGLLGSKMLRDRLVSLWTVTPCY